MLEQIEQQETREHVTVPPLEIASSGPVPVFENDQRQRRRMVIALVMLLVALGLVLVKDRDFWFPVSDLTESEAVDDSTPSDTASDSATSAASTAATPSVPVSKKRSRPLIPPMAKSVVAEAPANPVVPAARVARPPLRVEVVAGDQHRMVRPGSPSVAVELQNGASGRATSEPAQGGTEVASASTSTPVGYPPTSGARPEYPLLARQMKVQGAVELHAQIGKDGGVQTLQVVSGPAILADAAREAVKQWRFKPYIQNGQPVETQVPIRVNFTIQTK
jgi:TonB family protein